MTIKDFKGFFVVVFHVGMVCGGDGMVYDFEIDVCAF